MRFLSFLSETKGGLLRLFEGGECKGVVTQRAQSGFMFIFDSGL